MLCASDTIAVLSLLPEHKFNKMHSILFGEGVVNDAVSILIFRTVLSTIEKSKSSLIIQELTGSEYLSMFTDFLILSFSSIILGVIFGLGASLLLKYLHNALLNLDENLSSSKECTIMFAIAYLSYLIAESFHLSGIITLFCCGFTLAHYGYHNVTREC